MKGTSSLLSLRVPANDQRYDYFYSPMQIITLNKGREQSILRKHPWIFSRAIDTIPKGLHDGDVVQVQDSDGNVLGVGHFQDSSLAVRMLSFEQVSIDHAFWKKRIQQAFTYRTTLGFIQPGVTDAYRLVHGEGDQLPGLIIDVYGHVAVIQAHSIGMHKAQ